MNTAKMTPGPWRKTEQRETAKYIESIRDGDGRWIADCTVGNGDAIALLPEIVVALRDCITSADANCLTIGTRDALWRRLDAINQAARAVLSKIDVDTSAQ